MLRICSTVAEYGVEEIYARIPHWILDLTKLPIANFPRKVRHGLRGLCVGKVMRYLETQAPKAEILRIPSHT